MAYPVKTELFFKTRCFTPQSGISLCEKLMDCYQQFESVSSAAGKSGRSVLKQTLFIAADNYSEFAQSKQQLMNCANRHFNPLPPTSVISQSPEKDSLLLEINFTDTQNGAELGFRKNEESAWLVYETSEMKMVVASDLGKTEAPGHVLNQSIKAFTELQHILSAEEMDFSNIVRQWNYIEQITENVNHGDSCSQHYQIFNDVRSKYYQTAVFKYGFPAATGIGMDFGGVGIDFIAVKLKQDNSIIGIKSPVQFDAYNYSIEVLAENNTMNDFRCTTPKFERAKILITPEEKLIFVSGTAAIKGQESTSDFSVEVQTEMTIRNILSLIGSENLRKYGISGDEKAELNFLRVYVKFKNDLDRVKMVCEKFFPEIPVVFVVADICRPELLVEIEGLASIA
ncbi:MAG: hypothetical protein WAO52_06210 [Prolixibacteraceae bacterium]